MANNINVLQYTDAIHYINDCQKARYYTWTESYRSIARELSTGGPYFWLVVHGKKPFPRKIIEALPDLMSLNKRDSFYFQLLMHLSNLDMDPRFKIEVLNKFRPARFKGSKGAADGGKRKAGLGKIVRRRSVKAA